MKPLNTSLIAKAITLFLCPIVPIGSPRFYRVVHVSAVLFTRTIKSALITFTLTSLAWLAGLDIFLLLFSSLDGTSRLVVKLESGVLEDNLFIRLTLTFSTIQLARFSKVQIRTQLVKVFKYIYFF